MTIHDIYQAQRSYFATGVTRPLAFRKTQLKALRKAIKRYENEILAALHADMRKSPVEAYGSEIGLLYEEIDHMLAHLRQWMRPVPVSSPLMHYPSGSVIYREPKGLTLLIGPWNYPFQLLINPLIGAIAAGNCAILKPSELAPATEALIRKLIAETFKPELVAVVTGEGHVVIPELMQHRFDHIFFTGSIPVGKKILEMAAPHLSPVTLELGGKSPCIVDAGADLKTAARRIIWGKCWNAGQTCISPDYVLVHEKVAAPLMEQMKSAIHRFFGENPAESPDYPRLINEKRFDQVASYLEQGKIFTGGQTRREDKYIAPTVLTDVSFESPVMKEEIFGPVLPVIPYKTTADAIGMIAHNPYPLALYVFSNSRKTEQAFIEKVAFGGGCINNTLVHFANTELPFGGIGYSGMGRYHGRNSFNEFTHEKGVLKTATWLDVSFKYPPFKNRLKLLKMIQK